MSESTAQSGAPPPTATGEFEEFVKAKSGNLFASAFLLTGDRGFAEDLVQDALARTWRAWKRLHQVQNADAYTRRTMYHLHVSRWRRSRVAEIATAAPPERAVEAPDTALRLAVHAALLSLPATQRAAIVLRYFEDLTEAAAAEILGCPASTLRARAQRGLRRLRQCFPELTDSASAPKELGFNALRGDLHD